MNRAQRINRILTGLLQLLGGLLLMTAGDQGLKTVLFILSMMFVISGLKDIIRYFTMTRHMVGGRIILYTGVIKFDFGIFSLSLTNAESVYIAVYLIGLFLYDGVSDIVNSWSAARMSSAHWKLKLASGAMKILLGVLCLFSMRDGDIVVFLYALSLVFAALTQIVSAFRRTAVIYVQQN